MSDGNGAPKIDNFIPPLSTEEFAEMVGAIKKRGLPVILYVFQDTSSIDANRLLFNAHYRQMGAVASELAEWARVGANQNIAATSGGGGGLQKPSIILPKDLRGQGQG